MEEDTSPSRTTPVSQGGTMTINETITTVQIDVSDCPYLTKDGAQGIDIPHLICTLVKAFQLEHKVDPGFVIVGWKTYLLMRMWMNDPAHTVELPQMLGATALAMVVTEIPYLIECAHANADFMMNHWARVHNQTIADPAPKPSALAQAEEEAG